MTKDQQLFITEKSKDMYIRDISKELGINYWVAYKYIRKNKLPQKKVQLKRAKIIEDGYFKVELMRNWAI